MINSYNMKESTKTPITMNWQGHEGLRYVQTQPDNKQEKYQAGSGLFEVLNEIFKPQQKETIWGL